MASKRARGRGLFPEDRPPAESKPMESNPTPEEGTVGDEHLRITVYATVDQLDHLDRERIHIRRATRKVLERTGIIRGLVEGWRQSGLDFAALGAATEEEVAGIVAERLSRSGQ